MRLFQVENSVSNKISKLQSRELQIGVLLGRLDVGQRNLIYNLHTFHTQEEANPLISKAAERRIDVEALAEKALQVSQLLTGGVEIVGFAVVAPGAETAAATILQLSRAANQVFKEKGLSEVTQLLLHVEPASQKISAKEYTANSKKGNAALRPCELKFQDVASQVVTMECRHCIDLELCLPASAESLGEGLSQRLGAEGARIRQAVPLLGGALIESSTSVAQLLSDDGHRAVELELLCSPAGSRDPPGNYRSTECCGWISLQGSVVGRAHVHRRDTASAAVEMLKADVARSIEARMDLMLLEEETDPSLKPLSQPPGSLQLTRLQMPRRAFFPIQGGLTASDYVFAAEGADQVISTAKEAFGSQLEANAIQWPEANDKAQQAKPSGWRGNEEATISSGLGEGRPPIPFGFRTGQQVLVVSTVICIVSCLLSYLILSGFLKY